MRLERRSSPPCPGANGQEIGTGLKLTLSCGTRIEGEVLTALPEATTLPMCADFCGTFHPRCEAINYSEAEGCRLLGPAPQGGRGGGGFETSASFQDDAAIASYPELAASTCRDGRQIIGGAGSFDAMCSQIINGSDIVQRHRETYEACAADCAETTDCAAFSWEASMERGFMNCYLKSGAPEGSLSALEGVDSGVIGGRQAVPVPANNGASAPAASGGFVTLVPGATPPASDDGSAAVGNPADDAAGVPPVAPAPTSTTNVIVTEVATVPADAPGAPGSSQQQEDARPASLSWVAAPVVGGVAAMLVVGILVIMFRKKRRNGGTSRSGGGGDGSSWKNMFGLLPGGRGRGMERLDDGDGRGVPVYEVKDGKVALRGSGPEPQRPMTGLFRTAN